MRGLQKRDSALFKKCLKAVETGKRGQSKILAAEIANIRTTKNSVVQSMLAIQWIAIRLKNFLEFQSLMVDLKSTIGVIQDVKSEIVTVVPEMTNVID